MLELSGLEEYYYLIFKPNPLHVEPANELTGWVELGFVHLGAET